jgi:hypothetical protein
LTGCAVFVAALGAPHFVLATMSIVCAVSMAAVCGIVVGRRDGQANADRAMSIVRRLTQSSGDYIAFLEARNAYLQSREDDRHAEPGPSLQ